MVNHKYKFIFVHINRTGGTSWERSFGLHHGHDHRLANGLRSLKCWNSYYKFAFVRNPWDRYVSIYKNRNIRVSFPKWIRSHIKAFRKNKLSKAFSPQLDWISDKNGKILVDYVARFENYKEEWYKICEIIGAKKKMRHVNGTKHRHYTTFYNDATIENVRILAAKDIAEFGYEFDK